MTEALSLESSFLWAWLLTLAIEVPLLLVLLKSYTSVAKIAQAGLAATTLTLPWLWFILPHWWSGEFYLVVGELGIVVVEAWLLAGWLNIGWSRALLCSAAANGVSLAAGLLINSGY